MTEFRTEEVQVIEPNTMKLRRKPQYAKPIQATLTSANSSQNWRTKPHATRSYNNWSRRMQKDLNSGKRPDLDETVQIVPMQSNHGKNQWRTQKRQNPKNPRNTKNTINASFAQPRTNQCQPNHQRRQHLTVKKNIPLQTILPPHLAASELDQINQLEYATDMEELRRGSEVFHCDKKKTVPLVCSSGPFDILVPTFMLDAAITKIGPDGVQRLMHDDVPTEADWNWLIGQLYGPGYYYDPDNKSSYCPPPPGFN